MGQSAPWTIFLLQKAWAALRWRLGVAKLPKSVPSQTCRCTSCRRPDRLWPRVANQPSSLLGPPVLSLGLRRETPPHFASSMTTATIPTSYVFFHRALKGSDQMFLSWWALIGFLKFLLVCWPRLLLDVTDVGLDRSLTMKKPR